MAFKSGFIAILGKPNVGKSTLLNTILGQKICIVSAKPNLTRKKILGIKNMADAQLIFIDTPGIHLARGLLNKYLVKQAVDSWRDADVVLFIAEAHTPPAEADRFALTTIKDISRPSLLVLNKIDLAGEDYLPQYESLFSFSDSVKISALTGFGIPGLLEMVAARLPDGPQYFPEEMVTNEIERSLVAEIIREKVFELLHEEVPYAVAVLVDEFSEKTDKKITYIAATIFVEKESQKGIVIGKGGALLKRIGQLSRAEIEELIGERVFLQLWVKVEKNWRKEPASLRRLGFA
jgi:GTP-binding protein Era